MKKEKQRSRYEKEQYTTAIARDKSDHRQEAQKRQAEVKAGQRNQ